ncbi:hypothetical protein DEIGR_33099 [Deinococcus grandis]|uniref:Uncharacterized protein n=1 Tax=Deinococcus grandis TaxID=57498 RepID=A0A100HN79_9DEIO|nr:hypothetical protein [Deinococcus grandis]BBN96875.1 hypothetical protein DEGR_36080 [Deinococcus grandis]GAQ23841.1 hypothetical protein DEIGR_33099 [Deinococcus grandis]
MTAQHRNTRAVQVWLLGFGLLAALPVPLSALVARQSAGRPLSVSCSATHPCPLVIHIPGQPLSALPMREITSPRP